MYRIEIIEKKSPETTTMVHHDPVDAVFSLSGWRQEYANVDTVELPMLEPHEIQDYASKLHVEAGFSSDGAPVVDWWHEILISVANAQNEYQPHKAAELITGSQEIKALCDDSGIRLLVVESNGGGQPDAMLMLGKDEEVLWDVFKSAQRIIEAENKSLIVASTREAMNFKGGSSSMWSRSIYDRSYASWVHSL
jgi:hypothetical protein